MEPGIILVVLIVLGIPVALAVWLVVHAVNAKNRIEELSDRLVVLESEVIRLKRENEPPKPAAPAPAPAPAPQPKIITPPPVAAPSPIVTPQPVISPQLPPIVTPPPIPISAAPPRRAPVFASPPRPAPKINWEQFMGVKGFAWIGGFALFLGVAFFVKYSFDNNLVPPELRVAIGFLAGLGLLIGGVVMSRKNFAALSQTLCATGVVILYAVTFACRSIYHFEFFGPLPTFLLMALITTTAFLLAVRLDALVVAILGILGGFLTPILLSTGQDNPLGLFGYIAILDAGLVFVALNKRWHFLTALGALGTVIMQIGWADNFFVSEKYFEGNKILIALAVLLGFNLLWLAANWLAQRWSSSFSLPGADTLKRELQPYWLSGSMLGLAAVALAFTAFFFTFPPLAERPVLLFSFVFLIDLAVAALVWLDEKVSPAQPVTGIAVFGLLAIWTAQHLTNELLNPALVFYLVFAVFHSALPAWLQRRHGVKSGVAAQLNHFFPPLALLLVLVPIFKLPELSFLVWPFVLLVDLLAIALAVMTATLLPVLVVLLLTLAATGALIFKIPPSDLTGLPTSFWLLGAFAVFFVAASVWLARKFKPDAFKSGLKIAGDINANETMAALLPASSAVLPFLLLIMATLRLPLANPSPVFGLALLLVVLLLGLTKIFSFEWMPLVGLISTFALESAWHFRHFDIANPNLISPQMLLGWYLIFFAAFAAFPFVFLKSSSDKTFPWAAAALAGPAQFLLIYRLVKIAWPNSANSVMGLLPAAFAVPALLSLVAILKTIPAENKSRLTQLAWFGGVALFFITLIFPVQFDRQWITIGWALEGAALLWLFHRVPHPGLRLTGVALLVAAFVRLAFNPAVLEYHPRAATPIFNWYLYAYGIVTVCLFAGARLLAPPRNIVLKSNVQPILAGLGTVLAFLLLNIEIADYFSEPGSTLTFQFRGNFPRDMTYSISWGLFALALLVVGIIKKIPAARYAAMALLCVTLLKLFFHDLSLDPLYRIGAFICVAVIAMLASFAYQKFFSATAKPPEAKDETPK
jgi:type II secretory pathway pseudopilin PulG